MEEALAPTKRQPLWRPSFCASADYVICKGTQAKDKINTQNEGCTAVATTKGCPHRISILIRDQSSILIIYAALLAQTVMSDTNGQICSYNGGHEENTVAEILRSR